MYGHDKTKQIAERIKADQEAGVAPDPPEITIRELIRWFFYERRTRYCVGIVRNALDDSDLRTVPDFEFPYIDAAIRFELVSTADESPGLSEGLDDPTVRIGALTAANHPPTAVAPDKPLYAATTLMMLRDYSQLPVMVNDRDVKGVISWKSIGCRLALGNECDLVRECMEPPNEISIEAPLFDAIGYISEHGYVLVKGKDRKITGIVTASDLVQQFRQLTGPFLVIGEIEGHLRRLIHRKFTVEELRNASVDQEASARIEGLADLTFGDHMRLLENRDNWSRLDLRIDRREFIANLDAIRKIRNDVMHFSPDGLDPEDVDRLHDFASFFRDLDRMGSY